MKNLKIENKLSFFNILFEQFGSISVYEIALIFCSFFVDQEIILITQLMFIPVFILYLNAKFNKPVMYVEIDMTNEIYIFGIAQIGRKEKKIEIPFKDIKIVEGWKKVDELL